MKNPITLNRISKKEPEKMNKTMPKRFVPMLLMIFLSPVAMAEVDLVLAPSALNAQNFPDYATGVNAMNADPSPGTVASNINDYTHQDDQLNVGPKDGNVTILRTDQKNLLNDFVTKIIPVKHANPREIVNGIRIITGKEGGRAEVLLNGKKETSHIQVICPEFQLSYIESVVSALDKKWVQDFEDGSSAIYYRAKHRDINYIDAVAFDAGTPDQSFRSIDTKNNAIYYHDDEGSIGGYMSIVEKVDVPPHEVMVDITVYEITEQDDSKLGLDYIAWKNGPGSNLFEFVLTGFSGKERFKHVSSILNPFVPARIANNGHNDLSVSANGRYISANYFITAAFMDFLAVTGNARVLTTGQLLAKSGTTGVFERIDEIVSFSPTIPHDRILDYSLADQKVGLRIDVTPYIGTESLEADITIDLSSMNGVTPQGLPIINHRFMSSSVVLKDGQPYVLGGLKVASSTEQSAGIPILSDIPLLGYLFGGETETDRENRVMIVMTPTVIIGSDTTSASVKNVASAALAAIASE
jgi:type II secretory pathway component GspD/PulD (secretin)